VYDGVATRIFLDGIQQAEIPCGQIEDFEAYGSLYLGGGWGGNNYLGSLSDLALWNRPLSATEIIRLYALQNQDSTFPSLRRPTPMQNLRILH
jgi:hypothetical protein